MFSLTATKRLNSLLLGKVWWTTSLWPAGSGWNEPDLIKGLGRMWSLKRSRSLSLDSLEGLPICLLKLLTERKKATITSVTTTSNSHIRAKQLSSTRLSLDQHQWRTVEGLWLDCHLSTSPSAPLSQLSRLNRVYPPMTYSHYAALFRHYFIICSTLARFLSLSTPEAPYHGWSCALLKSWGMQRKEFHCNTTQATTATKLHEAPFILLK